MNLVAVLRRESRQDVSPKVRQVALRTAFIARFIVLREGRRSRAHRAIEKLTWSESSTAYDLYVMIRNAFMANGDRLLPVDRDLKRALEHSERSVEYFFDQYYQRASLSFRDALLDYRRSNQLLFGEDGEVPRKGGWRIEE